VEVNQLTAIVMDAVERCQQELERDDGLTSRIIDVPTARRDVLRSCAVELRDNPEVIRTVDRLIDAHINRLLRKRASSL
jgi:hypothetical protein